MPSSVLVSRFRRHYPDPSLWRSPEYRTRDQTIPYGLFWIYLRAIDANMALERLSQARAVKHAIDMAFAKQGASLPESLKRDQKDAYVAE